MTVHLFVFSSDNGTHTSVPRLSAYTQVHTKLLQQAIASLVGYSRTSYPLRQFDVGHSRSEHRAVHPPYFLFSPPSSHYAIQLPNTIRQDISNTSRHLALLG